MGAAIAEIHWACAHGYEIAAADPTLSSVFKEGRMGGGP